jgi:hypothetical protein
MVMALEARVNGAGVIVPDTVKYGLPAVKPFLKFAVTVSNT